MNFKEFKDLSELQKVYDEFVDNASVEELFDLGEKISRVGMCMHSEAKFKQYENLNFEGKFLKIYNFCGDVDKYMYCTSNSIRCGENVEDAQLTLWGMYFLWNDSRYVDDAYGTFDVGGCVDLRAEWIKEGLDKHNAGDTSNKNYIEEITEEEFISAYEEFKKFINNDIKKWIDCMRTEPEKHIRKSLIEE